MDIVLAERPFTEQDVLRLESAFLKEEQVDCPVTHHFGPGVYIREVIMPTGAYIIGHDHKHPQFNIMLEGRLTLIRSDGTRHELTAPQTFVGAPGKKIAYIHETVRWQNVYATAETDVETLEDWLYEPSDNLDEARQLLTHDKTGDRADYAAALTDLGLTEADVEQAMGGAPSPMPHGSYKMQVSASSVHGKGVFSTAEISAHEMIAPVRIGGEWTPAGRFINHSKTPNAEWVASENGDLYLFASEDISGCKGGILGEEITVDYRHALPLGAK
jgi:quercetin dioxygenase-like cupin family protein